MNKKEILIVLAIFFLFAFILNLCGFADFVDDVFDLDGDEDDVPDDEEEEEQEEEEEEELPDPLHCSNVRYTKSTDGVTTTWTAIGMPESTFLESKSQLVGGYIWSAYWNKDPMGHISPDYGTRFLLNSYIQGLPNNDIYNEQQWWYSCMISTGHGGIF